MSKCIRQDLWNRPGFDNGRDGKTFVCRLCNETLPIDQFIRTGTASIGDGSCIRCKLIYQPSVVYFRKRYGVSFWEIWWQQSGLCAACGSIMQPSNPRCQSSPAMDHDHSCCDGPGARPLCGNCNRGLVHSTCNLALGAAGDSADKLRKLADYLEKNKR